MIFLPLSPEITFGASDLVPIFYFLRSTPTRVTGVPIRAVYNVITLLVTPLLRMLAEVNYRGTACAWGVVTSQPPRFICEISSARQYAFDDKHGVA